MGPDVAQLAQDSGPLITVTGDPLPGGRFTCLFLQFRAGTLKLACNDDTDEIVASVVGCEVGRDGALEGLTGLTLDYAWELRNHRGYLDAFQIRLRDDQGREETLQFEVAASAIDVRHVVW